MSHYQHLFSHQVVQNALSENSFFFNPGFLVSTFKHFCLTLTRDIAHLLPVRIWALLVTLLLLLLVVVVVVVVVVAYSICDETDIIIYP